MSDIIDTDAIDAEVMKAESDYLVKKGNAELEASDQERMLQARRTSELNRIAADLPDDPTALWSYAEHSLTQSAISMIDAGRAFLKLKEILPHGAFQAGLNERGIPARTAQRTSASAARFADRSEKFLKMGRTKLYACLDFSDDDLDALEDGQSILDITLDDMDRMTSRELKAAIKKRDVELALKDQMVEATNKVMADKDARFNELDKELHLRSGRSLPWHEQIAPLKDEMNMVSNVLDEALGKMLIMHHAILNMDLDDDVRDVARRSLVTRYAEVMDRAAVLVAECQGQFDLELCGYIGGMREFIMQVPGEDLSEQAD